jgi:hypothetical protein
LVFVLVSHEPSPHTQIEADPTQLKMTVAEESVLLLLGEVMQQVLLVRLQLAVAPHLNVGPTQLPLPSQ